LIPRQNWKTFLPRAFFLGGLLAIVTPAIADDAPRTTEQSKKVETLVINAAALVDKEGKAAFAEFRKQDSEWFHGDTYVFAYDLKGNVLLNPAFPQREGTN
jgi:cytochrome c